MLARECFAHGEARTLPLSFEMNYGTRGSHIAPLGRNHGRAQVFQRNVELPRQRFGSSSTVRIFFSNAGEGSARTNHRLQQPASRNAIAEIKTVCDNPLNTEMLRQRAHDVLQSLAYQNDFRSGFYQLLHLTHAALFQLRLQLVLKEFLTQQIQAIASHSAQDGMDCPGSKLAIRGIKKRSQQRHQEDLPPPPESFGKGLRIPGKESHRPDYGQVEQAALYAPEDGRGCTGIVVGRFQICGSFLYRACSGSQAKFLL